MLSNLENIKRLQFIMKMIIFDVNKNLFNINFAKKKLF